MEKVLVLLSTYNGENFLTTQLMSILNQTYPNLNILIRDDGSTDKTTSILRSFVNRYPDRIKVIYGNNIGCKQSFFSLMQTVPTGNYFYALCDQDDYWLPEKISKAIEALKTLDHSKPLLYCSALTLTDENLTIIGHSQETPPSADFRRHFFSTIPTGCTSVFNENLRKLALTGKDIARNHDSWLLTIASFFGEVFIDMRSYILYRQHKNNVIGLKRKFWSKTSSKLSRIISKDPKFSGISSRAQTFFARYQHLMSERQRMFVKMIAGYRHSLRKTIRLALSREVKTNNWYDTATIRILILCGYI